jgi:hypothetical protein
MTAEDTEFDFHLTEREEAAGVARCVRGEYGDRYPYKLIYDADRFYEACSRGDMTSMVAVDGNGSVAAHVALTSSPLLQGSMELSMGIVCREYRNRSLMSRISGRMFDHAKELGLTSVSSQPVTHHLYAQKICAAQDYRCCGFVFHIENEGLFESFDRDHRGSIALVVRMLKEERRKIYVPWEALPVVRSIVSDMDLDREFAVSRGIMPEDTSDISARMDDSLRYADTSVRRVGRDIKERLASEYERYVSGGCRVCRLLLNLGDPYAPAAYEIAKGMGYLCTGMFPGCSDDDYLMMVNTMGRPVEYDRLVIHEDYAGLLGLVRELDPGAD